MDGAGTLTIIVRFIVPLAIPGILTVTVLSLRDAWNEFPYVLALSSSDEIRTLPYQLFLLGDTFGLADQGLIQAFALLSIIPILVVYLWLEKYVVQGLTQGAVK
jgi:ABC-type glycerol-3-phosphate transport system permease component